MPCKWRLLQTACAVPAPAHVPIYYTRLHLSHPCLRCSSLHAHVCWVPEFAGPCLQGSGSCKPMSAGLQSSHTLVCCRFSSQAHVYWAPAHMPMLVASRTDASMLLCSTVSISFYLLFIEGVKTHNWRRSGIKPGFPACKVVALLTGPNRALFHSFLFTTGGLMAAPIGAQEPTGNIPGDEPRLITLGALTPHISAPQGREGLVLTGQNQACLAIRKLQTRIWYCQTRFFSETLLPICRTTNTTLAPTPVAPIPEMDAPVCL